MSATDDEVGDNDHHGDHHHHHHRRRRQLISLAELSMECGEELAAETKRASEKDETQSGAIYKCHCSLLLRAHTLMVMGEKHTHKQTRTI